MDLERSSGPDLLPRYNVEALGENISAYLRAAEYLEEDLKRSLFWTMRLSMEIGSPNRFMRLVPGFKHLAIGFLDPEFEDDAFGVIIFATPTLIGHYEVRQEVPSLINVDGYEFPIVIRRVQEFMHMAPHPSGGTGACWAESRTSAGLIGPGILTAKHVVGTTLNASIQLSCGCAGVVGDVGPDGIDAALVLSDCHIHHYLQSRIDPIQLIAPWMSISLDGASSGLRHTQVSAVTDTMGILNDSSLPARVFLAHPARAGDSGALVYDSQHPIRTRAVGLYMGAYNNPAGQTGGIAQHAYQAASVMDMELYI